MFERNTTYEKIDSNPLTQLQKNVFKKLDNWRKKGCLNENIKRKDLITSNSLLARIYGLPKVHKDNCPLRPIVSCVNCPTYNMSKIFKKILNDSLPKLRSFIKNSLSFRDTIIKNQIPNNYIMVSLDVTSLFTNIPIKQIQKKHR